MNVEPHGVNQHPWEISLCKRVILQLIEPPKIVLEIGVQYAGSFKAWSDIAADDALLIGVDVNPANLPTRGRQTGNMIVGRSPDVKDRVLDVLNGSLVDFLFIDADHAYSSVQADYNAFRYLVRPGGVVGLHDIFFEDVHTFWEEISCSGQRCITMCANRGEYMAMGIGLIAVEG